MVRPRTARRSLRFSRLDRERLIVALLLSLLAHLAVWGGYEAGKKTGLWKELRQKYQRHHPSVEPKLVRNTTPTMFVDVSQPSTAAPKNAKYYSDKNSRAANPETRIKSNQPNVKGKQREVPKINNTPIPVKAKPAPPERPQKPEESKPTQPTKATVAKSAKPFNPGILHPGPPQKTRKDEQQNKQQKQKQNRKPPEKKRPRTLREARAENHIAGLQMQQEGGVKRHALKSSLNAIATPFGAYDRAIIEAIQQRWYDLLDSQQYAQDRTGKVTIQFHLNPDGTVTESKITHNTVGAVLGYICLEAILQSAPFGKWPPDMRRMIGTNFREITFTFYYY